MTGYADFFAHKEETQKIIDKHRLDFNYNTAKSYLEKVGGVKAYIRSLGGVFTKYVDFTGKITTKDQLTEIGDYVWGLYDIWGVDYSNGCSYTFADNRYKAKDGAYSAFYPSENPSVRFDMNYSAFSFANNDWLPTVEEMLEKGYAITNCGQGVAQTLKKAGLVPSYFPDVAEYPQYYKDRGYNYKLIKNASELQVGDVLLFTNKKISNRSGITTLPNWFDGFFHTAIVGERDANYIWMYDSGHAYTYYGEFRNRRKIGDNNVYQWAEDWLGIRLDVVANLQKDGDWRCINNKWYYYKNGKPVTGWQYLSWSKGSNWFYFDKNGVMLTGWHRLKWSGGTDWFYFGASGAMFTGWQKLKWSGGENWFYFDLKSGIMYTGMHQLEWNGKTNWYCFDLKTGAMITGKQKVKVMFNQSGRMTGGKSV